MYITICGVIGDKPLSDNLARVSLSSLKSILVPTKMILLSGQWCLTSGTHFIWLYIHIYNKKNIFTFVLTLLKEVGLTTLKQIKKTSVCG